MSTVACLSSHCVADFRSWETLHPGLIWSLAFSELFRAPTTPCPCPSPLLSISPAPALHFLVEGARDGQTGRELAEGTCGPGFPSETPLTEPEHQGQFYAWRMGEGSPNFLSHVMGSCGCIMGVEGPPRASGGQALRPRRKECPRTGFCPASHSPATSLPGSCDTEPSPPVQASPGLTRGSL